MIGIRLDANSQVGMGHLYRCLPVAKVWRQRGETVVFFARQNVLLQDLVKKEGFEVCTIPQMPLLEEQNWLLARLQNCTILLIDGYTYTDDYIAGFCGFGRLVCAFDDDALYNYNCDVVINPHPFADKLVIKTGPRRPKLMLGGQYWCFREEYELANPITLQKEAARVLVLMGGADVNHYLPTVIKALAPLPVHTTIVLGNMTEHDEEIYALCKNHSRFSVVKSPSSMVQLMAKSDLAVSAGGNTVYELCVMGIPSIIVPQTANERVKATFLSEEKVIAYPGDYNQVTVEVLRKSVQALMENYDIRKEMASKALFLIKKGGKMRIVAELDALYMQRYGKSTSKKRRPKGCPEDS